MHKIFSIFVCFSSYQCGGNAKIYMGAVKVNVYKKWIDILETRTVLFIFSLELNIFGVAVCGKRQNSKNGCF